MHSVPDDHSHDYGNGPALAALRAEYPAWTIVYEAALGVYSAELRSENGSSLHYLAGHTLDELKTRLQTATTLDTDS
jgi:hypothetical protein